MSVNDILKPFASAAAGLPPSLPDSFEILLKYDATPFARVTAGEFRAAAGELIVGENNNVVAEPDTRGIQEALRTIRKAEVLKVDIINNPVAALIEIRRLLSYSANGGKTAGIRQANANVAWVLADASVKAAIEQISMLINRELQETGE